LGDAVCNRIFYSSAIPIAAPDTTEADLKGFQNLSGLNNWPRPIGFAGFGLCGPELQIISISKERRLQKNGLFILQLAVVRHFPSGPKNFDLK